MDQSPDLVTRAGEQLLRWRWPLVILAGLFNITVETVEDGPSFHNSLDAFYVAEVLLFGMLGPLCGGIALTLVDRSRKRQQRSDRYLNRHQELVSRLAAVQDWDELTALVVRFPLRFVDLYGACLLVYDQVRDRYQPDAQWWDHREVSPAQFASLGDPCQCTECDEGRTPVCLEQALLSDRLFPVRCPETPQNPDIATRYCLPLTYARQPVGLMALFLPPDNSLAEDQIESLSAMAASVAVALHDAQPQRSALIRAVATNAERQRIARDLHDTLGQSVGYLHLKLDQLTGDDPLTEILVVREELEQMRAVAGEAYLQVRRTIAELQPSPPADLQATLEQQGRQAAGRAGFKFNIVCDGVPRSLSPQTQQQVLHLLGEALNNVEKHAGASHVEI